MDERATQVGKNEALFRQVNERIERLNDHLPPSPTRSMSSANVAIQAA